MAIFYQIKSSALFMYVSFSTVSICVLFRRGDVRKGTAFCNHHNYQKADTVAKYVATSILFFYFSIIFIKFI